MKLITTEQLNGFSNYDYLSQISVNFFPIMILFNVY